MKPTGLVEKYFENQQVLPETLLLEDPILLILLQLLLKHERLRIECFA